MGLLKQVFAIISLVLIGVGNDANVQHYYRKAIFQNFFLLNKCVIMISPRIANIISNPGAFCKFDASSNALFASSVLPRLSRAVPLFFHDRASCGLIFKAHHRL